MILPHSNILIAGASGGIGAAISKTLSETEAVESLYLGSRSGEILSHKKATAIPFDYLKADTISNIPSHLKNDTKLDHVFITTGFLHDAETMPEKRLQDLNLRNLEKNFQLNTMGPALLVQSLLPYMRKDRRTTITVTSARVGSISDNDLGGWYSYRMAKASLNMFVKTASIETARSYKNLILTAYHPGTVETDLSKPFQKNVKPESLFSVQKAAEKLIGVNAGLTSDHHGKIYDWKGAEIQP